MKKKGVSAVIGYILLIVMVIGMSALVYIWLKSYVPTEIPNCPDEVSVMIKDAYCVDSNLKIKIKNNGRFGIDGYYLKATTSAEQEIATLNLAKNFAGGFIKFNETLNPSKESIALNISINVPLYTIEVTPVRFQKIGKKTQLISCGKAKITEKLSESCQSIS